MSVVVALVKTSDPRLRSTLASRTVLEEPPFFLCVLLLRLIHIRMDHRPERQTLTAVKSLIQVHQTGTNHDPQTWTFISPGGAHVPHGC